MSNHTSEAKRAAWRSLFGPKELNLIEEDDDEDEVAIFTVFCAQQDTSLPLNESNWAVIVEYCLPPVKVFTFRVNQMEKITRSTEYPRDLDGGRVMELGCEKISPRKLIDIAKSVNGSNQPSLMDIAWCRKFCQLILSASQETYYWDENNYLQMTLNEERDIAEMETSSCVTDSIRRASISELSEKTLAFSLFSGKDLRSRDIVEGDDETRLATFYLYTRPLKCAPYVNVVSLSHWAIVVEYPTPSNSCPCPRVFTFEAGKGDDGNVVAYRSMEYPLKRSHFHIMEWCTAEISPKKLLEVAQRNDVIGQPYELLKVNCQLFCKEFSADLQKEVKLNFINDFDLDNVPDAEDKFSIFT